MGIVSTLLETGKTDVKAASKSKEKEAWSSYRLPLILKIKFVLLNVLFFNPKKIICTFLYV